MFLKLMKVTTRPIRVEEAASVEMPQSATAVWSFISDPAAMVEIDESTEVGVTLPGSPMGLGEIQVFIQRTAAGRTGTLIEVVEIEPGRRAVTRSLDSTYDNYSTVTVEPLGPDRSRLTQGFRIDLPAGTPTAHVQIFRDSYKQQLHSMMARLAS